MSQSSADTLIETVTEAIAGALKDSAESGNHAGAASSIVAALGMLAENAAKSAADETISAAGNAGVDDVQKAVNSALAPILTRIGQVEGNAGQAGADAAAIALQPVLNRIEGLGAFFGTFMSFIRKHFPHDAETFVNSAAAPADPAAAPIAERIAGAPPPLPAPVAPFVPPAGAFTQPPGASL